MFNKLPTYNSSQLLKAVAKAQTSLRAILNDCTIELVIIENCNEHPDVKKKYNKSWINRDPQNWNIYFNNLSHPTSCFIVAIEQDENLSGLCFFDLCDQGDKNERLRIHAIERNEAHDRLRGVCISSFCEVALGIAQNWSVNRLSVLQPERNTRASYQRLGFTKSNHNEFDLEIGAKATINWKTTFDHRRKKLQPATP